ncbi:LCP family glycopolymer transferase [Aerococcus urinae]|uniref:LCP family glycopolymer transferase n=1 Tax=Aerococcus urinae TaxID=1376 RepID=UPI0018A6D901|nr:LCP family protein [Aerococcus urinae]
MKQSSIQENRRSYRHHQPDDDKNKGKARKIFKGLGLVLGIIVVVFIIRLAFNFFNFSGAIYQNVDRENMRDSRISLKNGDPVNILLEGIDNGALMYENVKDGRSDVMMVITINPKEGKSTILSLPRDTLAPQGKTNDFNKLNHAYMNGGMEDSINSIQRFLDVPIDHYVEVNMQGFIDIIDGMGGIEITSPMTFEQDGVSFTEGETRTLSGKEAMMYVRMRKMDPEGDIGRQKRQQQLVQAVIDRLLSMDTVFNYEEILNTLGDNLRTDLRPNDMLALQQNYLQALKNPTHLVFDDWLDLNLTFGWYLAIEEEDRIRMSNRIRALLELEPTQSAIVYPVSFNIPPVYFPVSDLNGNGILEDEEMAIKPGVYEKDKLDRLIEKEFGEEGLNYEAQNQPQVDDASGDTVRPSENGLPQAESQQPAYQPQAPVSPTPAPPPQAPAPLPQAPAPQAPGLGANRAQQPAGGGEAVAPENTVPAQPAPGSY